MKSFSNYIIDQVVFNEDVFSLLEASISKTEYGPGRQVVPKKNKVSSLSSLLGIDLDEKTLLALQKNLLLMNLHFANTCMIIKH